MTLKTAIPHSSLARLSGEAASRRRSATLTMSPRWLNLLAVPAISSARSVLFP
jgi:hypothetical protein